MLLFITFYILSKWLHKIYKILYIIYNIELKLSWAEWMCNLTPMIWAPVQYPMNSSLIKLNQVERKVNSRWIQLSYILELVSKICNQSNNLRPHICIARVGEASYHLLLLFPVFIVKVLLTHMQAASRLRPFIPEL